MINVGDVLLMTGILVLVLNGHADIAAAMAVGAAVASAMALHKKGTWK